MLYWHNVIRLTNEKYYFTNRILQWIWNWSIWGNFEVYWNASPMLTSSQTAFFEYTWSQRTKLTFFHFLHKNPKIKPFNILNRYNLRFYSNFTSFTKRQISWREIISNFKGTSILFKIELSNRKTFLISSRIRTLNLTISIWR